MKLLISAIVVSLMAFCAQADVSSRAYYQEVGSCTDDEWNSIYGTLGRRQLVRSRQLPCTNACISTYCPGSKQPDCRIIICGCSSRVLEESESLANECYEPVARIEAMHKSSYGILSDSCKEKIDTRKIECYQVLTEEKIGAKDINAFTLWNADSDTVVNENLVNDASFCADDFAFSIQAAAGEYVKTVKFELYGAVDYNYVHTEYGAPFTMFAEIDRDVQGAKYAAGDYDLIVTPDDDTSKAITLRFTIKPNTHPDCAPPAPLPTCSAQDHKDECRWKSSCRRDYKSLDFKTLGSVQCNSGVCYCGGAVCGCL